VRKCTKGDSGAETGILLPYHVQLENYYDNRENIQAAAITRDGLTQLPFTETTNNVAARAGLLLGLLPLGKFGALVSRPAAAGYAR